LPEQTTFSGEIDGVGRFTITPLDLGSLAVPEGTPMGGVVLPVQGFLVRHPRGVLLFDTGLGVEHAEFDRLLTPVRRPLEAALAGAGVQVREIQAVANSHLHYDHAGGNPLFSGIPIYVQQREYEGSRDKPYFAPERIDFEGADLRVIQGDAEILPGVRLVLTIGHTAGHQSLVIDALGGTVVLAGQAAYTAVEFADPEREPARGVKTAYDPGEFVNSTKNLKSLNPQRVYFTHDHRVWEPTLTSDSQPTTL
jgi:glyoxylase-like metal-dependent hydrolase (beta-lactamase superfamily II)